jgi:hypothetical protein
VATSAGSSIGASEATLNGSANPNGNDTIGWFRRGTTNQACNAPSGWATTSPATSLGSGTTAVPYAFALPSLSASTTYYFCAVVSNSAGTTYGNVLSFSTYPACLITSHTVNPSSPQAVGTGVALTATTSGCTAEYKWLKQPPGGSWQTARDWTTSNTFPWNTRGQATGTWAFALYVRAVGSSALTDDYSELPFDLIESTGRLLVHHGQDIIYVDRAWVYLSTIDDKPYDGVSFALRNEPLSALTVTQNTFAGELATLPAFTHSTHNFLRVLFAWPQYDWSDASEWGRVASNFGNLAAAIVASGKQIDGIVFDSEAYGVSPWPWDHTSGGGATGTGSLSPAGASSLLEARGRQVMDAIVAAWPSARVLSLYGPWVSYSGTGAGIAPTPYNDVDFANELQGPFMYGMVSSTFGTAARWIDGGESASYNSRSNADFTRVLNWQKAGLADSGDSAIVDPTQYKAAITSSLGVYDRDSLNSYASITALTYQAWLTAALQAETDQYVWMYTEQYDWLGATFDTGHAPVPQDWIDAVTAAKDAAP